MLSIYVPPALRRFAHSRVGKKQGGVIKKAKENSLAPKKCRVFSRDNNTSFDE